MTKLAVISGGLREPSSTRLLADRITAAVESSMAERNVPVSATVIELRPLGRDRGCDAGRIRLGRAEFGIRDHRGC